MLDKIEAVLFDLDGTLADSMWIWEEIDKQYLKEMKLPMPEDLQKFQDEMEGMGFTDTAVFFKNYFQIPDSIEEIMAKWVSMAEYKYSHEIPLKKGAKEFLALLKEKNIKVGICSSNNIELIRGFLRAHGIEEYFSAITTCCDVPKSKPAPDVYLATAEKLQTKPEHCLVFEDVPMGILAGKNAGMKVCTIEDAFSQKQIEKKKELADFYIRDYFQILDHTFEVLS